LHRYSLHSCGYIILGLGFAVRPIYVSSSGVAQLSDVLILCAAFLFLASIFRLRRTILPSATQKVMAFCLFYFILVNSVMGLYFGGGHQIPYLLYNIYYLVVFVAFSTANSGKVTDTLYKFGFFGLGILALQAFLGVQNSASDYRLSLGFNNPNQLGQYCLMIVVLALHQCHKQGMRATIAIQIILGAVLVVMSLSKAAMAALIVAFLLAFGNQIKFWVGVAISIGCLSLFVTDLSQISGLSSVIDRLTSTQSDDSLSGRGYDYVFLYREYLFFGAGEGFFREVGGDIEIHSVFGTILFSYGIFSLAAYVGVLTVLVLSKRGAVIIIPMMLFGLTHNIIRDEVIWILLSAFSYKSIKWNNKINAEKKY
jgi:hypothetical protein